MNGYTNVDKAIVALIMAIIGIANIWFPTLNVDPNVVNSIVLAIIPILVWFFPNLPKDA